MSDFDKSPGEHGRRAFTLIELLVVISIIALLMGLLVPVLSKARKQGKTAVCLTNMHQWGAIWQIYCAGNDSYFPDNTIYGGWYHGSWIIALRRFYETDSGIMLCPEATKIRPGTNMMIVGPTDFNWGDTHHCYVNNPDKKWVGGGTKDKLGEKSSYGGNTWVFNPAARPKMLSLPIRWHWRTNNIRRAQNVPLFGDCRWRGSYARHEMYNPYAVPPRWEDDNRVRPSGMRNWAMDRHNGGINMAFVDGSARKVGIKELWTLKWHRKFDIAGPYTLAGGNKRWPIWMKKFPNY